MRDGLLDLAMDDRLLWFLNRGSGVVLMLVLTVVLLLGMLAPLRIGHRIWPRFVTQALHRNLALVALALAAVHPLTAVADEYVDIRWFHVVIPFGLRYEPFWLALGVVGLDVVLLAVLSGLARHRFGPRAWRVVHLAGYGGWALGLAHGLGMGTDRTEPWSGGLAVGCLAAVVGAAVLRLGAPRRATAAA